MNINFYFHSNIEEKEKGKTEEYATKKMAAFEKFFVKDEFPPKVNFEFEFLVRKKHYRIEFQLESGAGKFIAQSVKKTIFEGIDEAVEDLKSQIKKQKDRLLTLRKRGGTSVKKKFTVHHMARFRKNKS